MVELVHWVQPDGDQDRVAGEGLLRAGDGPPVLINLGDGDRLHLPLPIGTKDGVRGVDGNAQAGQLVLVHLVAGTLRQRLAQADDVYASLEGVVARDQADVPAADGEQPLRGPHQVPVGQRLKGPRPVDPRQRVPLEGQRFLPRAGGHQQDVGLHDGEVSLP